MLGHCAGASQLALLRFSSFSSFLLLSLLTPAQVLMLVPNLNALAPFLSLLYLLSFCITNLACFVSEVTGLPNFRPSFKFFHWSTGLPFLYFPPSSPLPMCQLTHHAALAGTLSSLAVMFFINEVNAGNSFSKIYE